MKGTTTLSVRKAAGYNPGECAARKEREAAWEPAVSATRHPPSSAGRLAFACRASGRGKFSWYHDPLPSNCVADWVCPGGTGEGYPQFARCPGPEEGCTNLAVFFHACTL